MLKLDGAMYSETADKSAVVVQLTLKRVENADSLQLIPFASFRRPAWAQNVPKAKVGEKFLFSALLR